MAKRSGGLTALGFALVLSVCQAAGHHHAPQGSLLPACQGASALPSPDCGETPSPAFDSKGRLWVAFVEHGHVYVTHSTDTGRSFLPPRVVNPVPEPIYSDGENRPKIALGTKGGLYLSWTKKIEGQYAGDIRFSRSLDGGKRFSEPVTVNDDHAPISHRFDSLSVDHQGRIFIAWVDKRDLQAAKEAGKEYSGAAIYYAMSDDQGASFAFNRKLADHSCECCRVVTDVDAKGVVALWRHVYPGNLRDHAIARFGPHASPIKGLPPRATDDGWRVDGCPHHGPDLSLDGHDKAHMVWFSQGSKNRGITYGRFDLASERLDFEVPVDARGARPQVLSLGARVVVAWKSFDGEQMELRVMESADRGKNWGKPRVLARTANGSDYPFLLARGEKIFVSWQTRAEGYQLIPVETAE